MNHCKSFLMKNFIGRNPRKKFSEGIMLFTIQLDTILMYTVHGKYLVGGNWRIWWIVSYSPKFSWPIFTDTSKMYLAYALTVAYSPNFSSPIPFTCTVCQNFPSLNISRVPYDRYFWRKNNLTNFGNVNI